MKTQKKALNRVIMPLLACALAVGLVPANAIAFAQESAAQIINETVSLSADQGAERATADESTGATSAGTAAGAADESASDAAAAGADVADQTGATNDASQSQSSTAAPSDDARSSAETSAAAPTAGGYTTGSIERISADVPVDSAGQTVVGNVEYEGLTYRINTDGATATLVGLGSTAPKADVVVPAQIASGNQLYTVTNIRSTQKLGGGVHAPCRF